MTRAILLAAAPLIVLVACREEPAGNEAAGPKSPAPAEKTAASEPLGAPVSGDQAKKLMDDRHEGMEEIGDAFKLINREVKKGSPDLASIRPAAAKINELAGQSAGWFPPGTGPDVGKTRAKAEIWQKPEDFAAKTRTFQQVAAAFNAAAAGGDVAAIKAGAGELGKTCKACHDLYRSEEKEHD